MSDASTTTRSTSCWKLLINLAWIWNVSSCGIFVVTLAARSFQANPYETWLADATAVAVLSALASWLLLCVMGYVSAFNGKKLIRPALWWWLGIQTVFALIWIAGLISFLFPIR